jgi:hypothetical protein
VADLLSGGKFEDIDFFLVDDDAQINMLVNNLNAPNRTVGVSDRYGYDYALTTSSIALYSTAKYTAEKLSAEAYLQLGNSNTRRRGFFCKELFADNSYGASKTLSFADLAARIALQYRPNPKHCIMGSAAFVVKSADGQDLFLQTEYNNLTVSSPAPSNLLTVDELTFSPPSSIRGNTSTCALVFARRLSGVPRAPFPKRKSSPQIKAVGANCSSIKATNACGESSLISDNGNSNAKSMPAF